MPARNTRQQILDAAQRLIETGGFLRLTTKEIAQEAGCAEGTLFKYFAHKEDLCLAVVLENAPRFRETIARMQPGKGTLRKNLEQIALGAIRFSEKLLPLGVMVLGDARLQERLRGGAATHGERGPQETFEVLGAYISGEQALGRIDKHVQPLSVAALLFGPCFHWAFVRQGIGRGILPIKDQEFVTNLVAALMRGLSPSEGA